ncbi:hypothetical protein IU412_19350 [Nocardia cyriacigeorgica]|jgi:hypothetical protein|nr:hypothetical protein C5B73_03600 [Nocardia cyriacigeorgica]MBF6325217.1 hypothetical protein [Nocardia cyriacigeorgica]MBF6498399.1 hypothetical protein [Nocardia cyriacigeorgica]PPJ00165.1 hypothetical protein C5E43_29530 [Nocardia cyriacigeorgica]TLF55449.1 hypothetical protein FEK31_20705 [Nocardia cyriacigeorgica]
MTADGSGGEPMTQWQAMTGTEIAELGTRLRSLAWSWQVADGPALATEFGWRVLHSDANWVMLDTGFGLGSGEIRGKDGRAEVIEVRVTDFAEESPAGRERIRDAFAALGEALTEALGAPTARVPGEFPQLRWAGAEQTLVLHELAVSVVLKLIDNTRLARDDRNVELEEQGLL